MPFSNFRVKVLYRYECRREKEHCQERNTFHCRTVSLARGGDTFGIFSDFDVQLAVALASKTVDLGVLGQKSNYRCSLEGLRLTIDICDMAAFAQFSIS